MIATIMQDSSTVIIDQPDFGHLVKVVGYPILDNLPGIVIAFAVVAVTWFILKKMRK